MEGKTGFCSGPACMVAAGFKFAAGSECSHTHLWFAWVWMLQWAWALQRAWALQWARQRAGAVQQAPAL